MPGLKWPTTSTPILRILFLLATVGGASGCHADNEGWCHKYFFSMPKAQRYNFVRGSYPHELALRMAPRFEVTEQVACRIVRSALRTMHPAPDLAVLERDKFLQGVLRARLNRSVERIKKLLATRPTKLRSSALFPPPAAVFDEEYFIRRVTLPAPDPQAVLMPNECWAGKGSNSLKRIFQ